MHELGIARNIVAIVAEAAGERKVTRVTLEVGRLSGVVGEAIGFCWDVAAAGTALEGAALDIVDVEGQARCLECQAEFPAATLYATCGCGSRRMALLHGEELHIRSMELKEMA